MSAEQTITLSVEELAAARERLRRAREHRQAQQAAAAQAQLPRHEARAIEQERARWRKADYKPGLLAPDSTTQYTKTYRRAESPRRQQRRAARRVELEEQHKRWLAADAAAKEQQQEARQLHAARCMEAAARPRMRRADEALLVSDSTERMSLADAAEELKVPTRSAARILQQYGAERQPGGTYLRGQVLRAALVWRNEHPLIHGTSKRFLSYDEAAAYVGVHRDTIKHRARWDGWKKYYLYNTAINQVCCYFRRADIDRYKDQYDAWLNEGDSDHTHCLKMRQRRRNSPRKPKRR